jgi:hypothetical protein
MSRVTQQPDSRGRAPPPQLQRKHQVRQLGLTVGLPWRVCCFPLQVIEIDPLMPMFAAPLETVVTLGDSARSSAGISKAVSANGPRKLVPNCNSKPSAVSWRFGTDITPALFTRRSSFASRLTLSANARTDRRFAKSSVSKCTLADGSSRRIRSTASRSFASDRAARITSLPARQFQRRMPANTAVCPGDNRQFSGLGWNISDSPSCVVHLVSHSATEINRLVGQ